MTYVARLVCEICFVIIIRSFALFALKLKSCSDPKLQHLMKTVAYEYAALEDSFRDSIAAAYGLEIGHKTREWEAVEGGRVLSILGYLSAPVVLTILTYGFAFSSLFSISASLRIERASLLGDLIERRFFIESQYGKRAATRWFYRQLILSIPPLAWNALRKIVVNLVVKPGRRRG